MSVQLCIGHNTKFDVTFKWKIFIEYKVDIHVRLYQLREKVCKYSNWKYLCNNLGSLWVFDALFTCFFFFTYKRNRHILINHIPVDHYQVSNWYFLVMLWQKSLFSVSLNDWYIMKIFTRNAPIQKNHF